MNTKEKIEYLGTVLYNVVHGYVPKDPLHERDKGPIALARRNGWPAPQTAMQFNPDNEAHKPNIEKVITVLDQAGHKEFLMALCEVFGGVFVETPNKEAVGDLDFATALTKWSKEFGETNKALHDALEDGRITKKEADKFAREMREDFAAAGEVLGILEAWQEPEVAKPANVVKLGDKR